MPRPALVSREDAISVVEKFINHFLTAKLPIYSSPVWKEMSKELDGKWSSYNFYTSVTKNRRGILSSARENLGVIIEEELEPVVSKIEGNIEKNEENYDDGDNYQAQSDSPLDDDYSSDFELDTEAKGLSQFEIFISREEWREMKGRPTIYRKRVVQPLNRGVWSDKLALIIAEQIKLPCAFVFDHSRISLAPKTNYYLKIQGHCKSKLCENPIIIYADRDPGDNDFYMSVRTRDTINQEHESVVRPVRKEQKNLIKKQRLEVVTEGTEADRKHVSKFVNIYMCKRCNYPNVITPKS